MQELLELSLKVINEVDPCWLTRSDLLNRGRRRRQDQRGQTFTDYLAYVSLQAGRDHISNYDESHFLNVKYSSFILTFGCITNNQCVSSAKPRPG